ncbi:UNKNOWN [Stylonychia lemnae]|uniref:Homeobox domain-containing protein n=1 Tax=Stylonychia lemnae TaxID=5949 RepID=A0A078B0Q4_STYLE|nr:UNKNOWN [Stylonychia lemnae]|eukprot:CDW86937.1 UNKNOWN [Stylonychia lemnae]
MNTIQANETQKDKLLQECRRQCEKVLIEYQQEIDTKFKISYEVSINLIPKIPSAEKVHDLSQESLKVAKVFNENDLINTQLQQISSKQHLICGLKLKNDFEKVLRNKQKIQRISHNSQNDQTNAQSESLEHSSMLEQIQYLAMIDGTKIRLDKNNASTQLTSESSQIFPIHHPNFQFKSEQNIDLNSQASIEKIESCSNQEHLLEKRNNDIKKESFFMPNKSTSTNEIENKLINQIQKNSLKRKLKINKSRKTLKKRLRSNIMKSDEQLIILQSELSKNQQWTSETLNNISQRLGLKRVQVYKWYWDRKEELLKLQMEKLQHFGKLFQITRVNRNKSNSDIDQEILQSIKQEVRIFNVKKVDRCININALSSLQRFTDFAQEKIY